MMGRAGRPQFDDEGVAVVMTSQNDKMRIEKLVKSETMLESWFVISDFLHHTKPRIANLIPKLAEAFTW
jgi:ATP-dependent DNA helicase HFM1/MER3